MAEEQLRITGMTCGGCAGHVTRALEGVKGVKQAVVNLEAGTATVTTKDSGREALVAAVVAAGYGAS